MRVTESGRKCRRCLSTLSCREGAADHSPRDRGRPATYPPAIPDIEYLAHFRGTQLACCNRYVILEDVDLWLTQSVAPASTTIYVALSCSCAELPIVNQSCTHITLGPDRPAGTMSGYHRSAGPAVGPACAPRSGQ